MTARPEGARFCHVLNALRDAGVKPDVEGREGLYGPSMAVFSQDRAYRYLLTRRLAPGALMTWVMLNPSTADAFTDDATIVRVTKRAIAAGFGGIAVVNLFALRATDPAELDGHPDPAGPGNDACLLPWCQPGDTVVAAWGNGGALQDRAAAVGQILAASGADLYCLGITDKGQPRHPGRLGYSQQLMPWRPA